MQFTRRFKSHWPLLVILIVFSALTLYQSVVLPLGEAADETDHYQYLRFVARTGHPPLTETERNEAGFKGGLAPLYYWLVAWPIAWVGEDALPDIRRVDSRPQRHLPDDGLGINHVLHTLDEQWPWRGQPLAWHLVRLLSLPMGWVTIIATYALARRLFAARLIALGAAAFVAFLPRFVFSAAVINDDNLVFALIALLLLVQVILLQHNGPPSLPLMTAFGALFGLALITKYFSLILLPTVLFTLWFVLRKPPRSNPLLPAIYFLLPLFLTAGLWFIFIALRFNQVVELGWIAGLAASLGEPQITEGLVGLLAGQSVRPPAATYSLPEWLGLLYRSFWFEFGWMRIFAPAWVYWLFSLFTGLALLGLAKMAWQHFYDTSNSRLRSQESAPQYRAFTIHNSQFIIVLLSLHLALFIAVVAARYVLSATIDTGQGRHLYPALPVIALLISVGVYALIGGPPSANRPAINSTNTPPATRHSLPALLFLASCFLLPALASLLPSFTIHSSEFRIHISRFVSHHYHTHPVTIAPTALPALQRVDLKFEPGLSLVGFDAPASVVAGEALPVTLVWHAEQPGRHNYLVSACLEDGNEQPVACSRTLFEDGRYPPPAWEPGDTLIDTLYLPTPVCARLLDQPYTLHLQLWQLDAAAPTPIAISPPVLEHRAVQPQVTIQPTDALRNRAQSLDLWLADGRLTDPTTLSLGQSLAQISYFAADETSPQFVQPDTGVIWHPLPQLDTDLFLPCDEGPTPFARLFNFIVDATLPPGEFEYRSQNTDDRIQSTDRITAFESVFCTLVPGLCSDTALVTLDVRQRRLGPITGTLTFSQTLAPLSLAVQDELIRLEPIHAEQPTVRIEQSVGQPLPVTVQWQTHRRMAEPLVIALKLIDSAFQVGGERIATLGDRYPSVLWQPTEVVEETYPLQILPAAPPGLYRLELGLIREDNALPGGYENLPVLAEDTVVGSNLYPVAVRLLDPTHGTSPPNRLNAVLGDDIRLAGYQVNPRLSGSPQMVALTLYWESTQDIDRDYTVFTQLLGPDGQVWAQWDNPPQGGLYPTSAWATPDSVVDRYTLTLRPGAPTGTYQLLAGMYDSASGERLPATVNGQPQPDNAVEVGVVLVP